LILDSPPFIGRCAAITRLKARIPELSADTEPLVIIGEPGVGKTLFARAIHARSPRRALKFQSVNFSILSERDQRVALLGGVPPELSTTRRSCLELPSTVILKHVDCTNPFLQERLAEALTKKKVTRLGSDDVELVHSRPVFALLLPVSRLYQKGRIIEPLFRKLREFDSIAIPPLRERKEDIPLLIDYFLNEFLDRWNIRGAGRAEASQTLKRKGRIETGLLGLLRRQQWKGNVLELKAYIRNVLLVNHRGCVQEMENFEVMKMILMAEEGSDFSLRQYLSVIEEGIINRALTRNSGSLSKTAHLLGMSERSFNRRAGSHQG
jgi:DNA-binding NtrC family response regulator